MTHISTSLYRASHPALRLASPTPSGEGFVNTERIQTTISIYVVT